MDFLSFNETLKKLADKIEEYVVDKPSIKHRFLNRIDLDGFKQVQNEYVKDRSLCKKTLEVKAKWLLDLDYGPQFETRLKTERAGEITIQTDEITLFGGGGTAVHPISLCFAGFCGCFSAAFAKWAAMEGIELKTLKIRVGGDLDFSAPLGIDTNVPMVDQYKIDLFIESDADLETLNRIAEITKERCFCYWCITTPIIPQLFLKMQKSASLPPKNLSKPKIFNDNLAFIKQKMRNRVNLETFIDTLDVFSQDRSLCKRVVEAEGNWRLGVQYGPQFEIKIPTERAGEITIQTDETIILGGGGTSFHPVALCISGFAACLSTAFARWAGLKGIALKKLECHAVMNIDLTTGFGIEPKIPMIDNFEMEFLIESDAEPNELFEILEIVKKRAFCYYCYSTPLIPEVTIHKLTPETLETITEKPTLVLDEKGRRIMELIQISEPHNIKAKIGRKIKMNYL